MQTKTAVSDAESKATRCSATAYRTGHHDATNDIFAFWPPVKVVEGGRMFYCLRFFLFSPRDLRAPSADRCETLQHGRQCVRFYNPNPKIRGLPHEKKI